MSNLSYIYFILIQSKQKGKLIIMKVRMSTMKKRIQTIHFKQKKKIIWLSSCTNLQTSVLILYAKNGTNMRRDCHNIQLNGHTACFSLLL